MVIEGDPLVLVKGGEIMENTLLKVHLDIDTLQGMLRDKEFFSLLEVEYAIFETEGNLSVMKKDSKQNAMKREPSIQYLMGIISDGKVNDDALSKANVLIAVEITHFIILPIFLIKKPTKKTTF
jgi:uncharacterized membrane protein YcaP (DUF421 family)